MTCPPPKMVLGIVIFQNTSTFVYRARSGDMWNATAAVETVDSPPVGLVVIAYGVMVNIGTLA